MTNQFRWGRATSATAVVAISAFALVACSSGDGASTDAPDGTTVVTIGVLAPLTGDFAADGKDYQSGAELAVKELNETGAVPGYQFELEIVDVQNQATDAVNAGAEQLINDDVDAVVTAYASPTNFEIDKFADAGMPYILGGNTVQTADIVSKDPERYSSIWSVTPNYDLYNTEPVTLADRWVESGVWTPRDKSVYIIKSDNPYSAGIADGLNETFTEEGWTVVAVETIPFGAVNDWQTQLAKIRQLNPDYIINTDYQVSNEVSFMDQFVQNPTQSLVFLQYGPNVAEFLDSAGENADGVLYNNLASPVDSPDYAPAQHLREKWQEAYGTDFVPSSGMNTYTGIMLYADALLRAGSTDKAAISQALGESDIELANGRVVFDQTTHLSKAGDDFVPIQSYQIQGGERFLLAPEQFATGEFVLPPWME